jgi:hypothetical protein
MINNFKIVRDNNLKNVCSYFRNHKDSSSQEFKILWEKFMSISELLYIFEDYPYVYNIFVNYINKKDSLSFFEYEEAYDYHVKLLYKNIKVYR